MTAATAFITARKGFCYLTIKYRGRNFEISLTDQNRAQADFEIDDLGLPLAQVGEGLREAGSRHDFKEHIGQADLGHAALDVGTQGAQALGFLEPVERGKGGRWNL